MNALMPYLLRPGGCSPCPYSPGCSGGCGIDSARSAAATPDSCRVSSGPAVPGPPTHQPSALGPAGTGLGARHARAAWAELAEVGATKPQTRRPAGGPAGNDAGHARRRCPADPAGTGAPQAARSAPRARRCAHCGVVYAGSAHTLVPLSDDLATTANLLQAIKPSLMPESGQRVDLAVEQGLALLEQGAQGRGRLLLIGTGIPAEQQQAIGQQLGDDGERLLILGVGTPEGARSRAPKAASSRMPMAPS